MSPPEAFLTQLGDSSLLVGREWRRTRRALLLATGFFIAIAGFDLVLSIAHADRVPGFVWGTQHAFLIETDIDLLAEVGYSPGLVVIAGLAAIHASLNAGYLPSLILATAPVYAMFVFTVSGPVSGVVIPVYADVVFAPLWAAFHVLPNTVAYGTLGFLLGVGLQQLYGRVMSHRKSPSSG